MKIAGLLLTEKGHLALGHHLCPDCGNWFVPQVKRQIYCVRCERADVGVADQGRPNPCGKLIYYGLEDNE